MPFEPSSHEGGWLFSGPCRVSSTSSTGSYPLCLHQAHSGTPATDPELGVLLAGRATGEEECGEKDRVSLGGSRGQDEGRVPISFTSVVLALLPET